MDRLGKIDLAKSVGGIQDLAKATEPLAKGLNAAADAAERMKAALGGGIRLPGDGASGGAPGSGSGGGSRAAGPHGSLLHGATDTYFASETAKQVLAGVTAPMRLLSEQQARYGANPNSGNTLNAAIENAKQTVGDGAAQTSSATWH